MLQIAAASREDVAPIAGCGRSSTRVAGGINSEFGEPDWTPLRSSTGATARTRGRLHAAARVGMVTPLRDGMNLVAKEYVAAQDPDDPGVLVLSRFAGAAAQLDAALLVNPHDPDDMADALDAALECRWPSGGTLAGAWAAIEHASPVGWGRSFLAALLRTVLVADEPATRPRAARRAKRGGHRHGPPHAAPARLADVAADQLSGTWYP